MFIYKFRISHEDHDDFIMDIEVMSNQTFEDFHNFLVGQLKLDKTQLASFYISNSRWDKKQEITLMDMSDGEEDKLPVMKETKISAFIEDPHQRLIYINDFLNLRTFYIDLLKITKVDGEQKKNYPKVFRLEGTIPTFNSLPLKAKTNTLSGSDLLDDTDLLSDEMIYDEDEISDFEDDDNNYDVSDGIGSVEENDFNY